MILGNETSKSRAASSMKTSKTTIAMRTVLGLIFIVGPLTTALHLAPQPALPAEAAAFTSALARSGYFLPMLWTMEIATGALLISGYATPLALVVLAPVVVNIAAFHLFLAPRGIVAALMITALELSLAWRCRAAFWTLFVAPKSVAAESSRTAMQAA